MAAPSTDRRQPLSDDHTAHAPGQVCADERQPVLEDNEAHVPGKMCERWGQAIAAGQDARLLSDGSWVHEARPMEW